MVFHPLPVMFLIRKIKNYRIIFKQKIESSKKNDFLIIKKFNKNFSNIQREDFIKKFFIKNRSKLIFISETLKFGKNRSGNMELLKKKKNFKYKTKTVAS